MRAQIRQLCADASPDMCHPMLVRYTDCSWLICWVRRVEPLDAAALDSKSGSAHFPWAMLTLACAYFRLCPSAPDPYRRAGLVYVRSRGRTWRFAGLGGRAWLAAMLVPVPWCRCSSWVYWMVGGPVLPTRIDVAKSIGAAKNIEIVRCAAAGRPRGGAPTDLALDLAASYPSSLGELPRANAKVLL